MQACRMYAEIIKKCNSPMITHMTIILFFFLFLLYELCLFVRSSCLCLFSGEKQFKLFFQRVVKLPGFSLPSNLIRRNYIWRTPKSIIPGVACSHHWANIKLNLTLCARNLDICSPKGEQEKKKAKQIRDQVSSGKSYNSVEEKESR